LDSYAEPIRLAKSELTQDVDDLLEPRTHSAMFLQKAVSFLDLGLIDPLNLCVCTAQCLI
jgi:hypothetical protein